MNKLRVVIRFILLSFLLSATLTPAQVPASEMGTLQGVVTDANGAVRRGASVLIQHWRQLDNYGSRWEAVYESVIYTDSEGRFSVQLPPDTYDVFIAHLTLSPFAKKIKIEGGKVTALDCELPLDP